jgi:NAD(P)-dependent dehydrogenase (short-subunit alcohol dehydrogenase family)
VAVSSFAGKNVLVVGGSAGIGLALVGRLADEGALVTVWGRTQPEVPDNVRFSTVDVTVDFDPNALDIPAPLHCLAYCPGSITLAPFHRLSLKQFRVDYEVNVVGAVRVLQACLGAFCRDGASVVLFSSVAARVGLSFHASIGAAKSGVEGLARSLAAELAPRRIRVNVVAPSLTDTRLAKHLLENEGKRARAAGRHPLGRVGSPADPAAAAFFLLSDEAGWATGQVLGIDGGYGSLKVL